MTSQLKKIPDDQLAQLTAQIQEWWENHNKHQYLAEKELLMEYIANLDSHTLVPEMEGSENPARGHKFLNLVRAVPDPGTSLLAVPPDGEDLVMPSPVSDSYDSEFGTSDNATYVIEGLRDVVRKMTPELGLELHNIVDVVYSENQEVLPLQLSEREWRLVRFGLLRALEETF